MKPHERLKQFIDEDRLIRKAWTKEEDGKQYACLLAAVSEDVAKYQNPSECPAEIMPEWLAHLTPWIDDAGTEKRWPAVIRRYQNLMSRWHVLTPTAWERLDYKCRRVALMSCRRYNPSVCDHVIALLDRTIAGETVSQNEWIAVQNLASKAAADSYTAYAAVDAARAAARAAAVYDDDDAAAARAAAETADIVTFGPAGTAGRAVDKIIDGMLDCIEEEIENMESKRDREGTNNEL